MEGLLKMGKQAYQQYSESQNNSGHAEGRTGSGDGPFNQHHDSFSSNSQGINNHSANSMIDADGDGIPDFQQAAHHANQHSGDAGDSSLFENAMGFLKSRASKDRNDDDDDEVDEEKLSRTHDRAYNQGQGGSMDAKSMGMAAAMQAFQQFSGSSNSSAPQQSSGGGAGGGQSKLVGMAMAQAAKLFDSSGGAASGGKQDAVNAAGAMIMKLMLKQKMGQMTGSGGNSSGLGGLASLAGKFM